MCLATVHPVVNPILLKDPSLSGSPKLVVTSTLSLRLLTAALIFAGCIATAHHALSETTSKGESEKFDLPKTPKGAVVFSPALCPSPMLTYGIGMVELLETLALGDSILIVALAVGVR
eukprot:1390554-Amorphochlora_amoeboformis.AAC.1